jgi:hypothetical protein
MGKTRRRDAKKVGDGDGGDGSADGKRNWATRRAATRTYIDGGEGWLAAWPDAKKRKRKRMKRRRIDGSSGIGKRDRR